jgi:hypothetical protein
MPDPSPTARQPAALDALMIVLVVATQLGVCVWRTDAERPNIKLEHNLGR